MQNRFKFLCMGMALAAMTAVGCGDDDGGGSGSGDCSECPESQQAQCQSTFSECTGGGGSAGDCQTAIDTICSLSSDLDAGA